MFSDIIITFPYRQTSNRRAIRLQISQSHGHLTSTQLTDLNEKRIALHRRIQGWRQVQMVYMPCVASLLSLSLTDHIDGNEVRPSPSLSVESMPLWLPSSLPASMPAQLRMTGLSAGLADKEARLRVAQADDALAEIRRQRRIVTGLVIFKHLNVSGMGQKKNTRIRTLFMRFNNKTERVAERYRAARAALEGLDPDGDWNIRLQILRPEDIRGPGRDHIDKKERRPEKSEKRREQSWIWLVPRVATAPDMGAMEEHLDANLRVEWAKSRARSARWNEEHDLLIEEMRRILAFLEWKASWWRSQAHRRSDEDAPLRAGLRAYAERQATLYERIAMRHAMHWLPVLKTHGIVPCWESKYTGMEGACEENQPMEGGNADDTDGEEEEGTFTEADLFNEFEVDIDT